MATLEDEVRDLKEKNNELVQKVQYWKMTAAQRENEKLNLMKEINELRLKQSRLRNNGNIQASNLDAALQSASEKALAHLVRASGEIARTMELAKAYMRDRQELDTASPSWSSIGTPNTDKKDKIHRVPPMMMGGQSIQPVVALSRTILNTSNPNVYIPLTRVDAGGLGAQNMETDTEANDADDSTEELGLNDSEERIAEESERMSEDEDFNSSRRLDAVTEEEPEDADVTPLRSRIENPLEGPSWMLDASNTDNQARTSKCSTNLEPDSTTELGDGSLLTSPIAVNRRNNNIEKPSPLALRVSCEFSPTVRRRKRTASPPPPSPRRPAHYSPRPAARRASISGRVLKVVVAKMSLEGAGDVSPPKRAAGAAPQFDAPSPNGATVAGVIVSETVESQLDMSTAGERYGSGERAERSRRGSGAESLRASELSTTRHEDSSRAGRASRRRGSRDSDSGSASGGEAEGRTRRPRRVVTYKEKPLNRKMRR